MPGESVANRTRSMRHAWTLVHEQSGTAVAENGAHGRNRHAWSELQHEVRNTNGRWLVTLTRGAYTVVLAGPSRRFAEGKASVSHAKWVRTYPKPYAGEVDQGWLEQALDANKARVPDVLAIAMQYIRGATAVHEDGLQIAGDARYGPGTENKRQEGAGFTTTISA